MKRLKKGGLTIGTLAIAGATPWAVSLNDVVIGDDITYSNEKAYEVAIEDGISKVMSKGKHINKNDANILFKTMKYSDTIKEEKTNIELFKKYLKEKKEYSLDELDELDLSIKLFPEIYFPNINLNVTASVEKNLVFE